MEDNYRTIIVNQKSLPIPVGATSEQIKLFALAANIEPSKWGSGVMELREYIGSGAKLLVDNDVPNGDDFGLREVDPKKEPGFKTLEGWDKEVVATYPEYIQKVLKGEGYRYFSGSWDETTIGPPGFMTPHQISSAAYVPLVNVYTLGRHEDSWYEIPVATWVNERREPNPDQTNGMFLLPIEDALPYVEAFRKYRAYQREWSTNSLPPEQLAQERNGVDLTPIREYIIYMKAKEQASYGPSMVYVPKHVAVIWRDAEGRFETAEEALERFGGEWPPAPESDKKSPDKSEPPLQITTPIREKISTQFKQGRNRFFKATGELSEEVNKLTVKWDGDLRIRLKPEYVDNFGELISTEINGFEKTLTRHRSGKYYQVRLDAEEMRQITEWKP